MNETRGLRTDRDIVVVADAPERDGEWAVER